MSEKLQLKGGISEPSSDIPKLCAMPLLKASITLIVQKYS